MWEVNYLLRSTHTSKGAFGWIRQSRASRQTWMDRESWTYGSRLTDSEKDKQL
jgi:hypothetical protein